MRWIAIITECTGLAVFTVRNRCWPRDRACFRSALPHWDW